MSPPTDEPGRESPPPGGWPRAATLRDGSTVHLRPIRPQDAAELSALHERLSPETAYQRFFTIMARLPPNWARILARVDYDRRMALAAEGPDGRLVAVARYAWDEGAGEAEIAIVVQDAWQGKGLGTRLLLELFAFGAERGIRRFRAHVLGENRRMLDLLARLGRVVEHQAARGVVSLVLEPHARPSAGGARHSASRTSPETRR